MATIQKFEDLEIWQQARAICQNIEMLIQTTNLKTNYSLKDQIAKGSCGEVKSQSYRAFDKNLINEEEHLHILEITEINKNRIAAMMNYLNNCEIKGLKFK